MYKRQGGHNVFCLPYFLGGQVLIDTLIITILAHLLKCLLIHVGSNVLNKSKFHYIYSFNPKLERQRMGFQESGTKEDGILLVWNSMYSLCCPLCMGRRPWMYDYLGLKIFVFANMAKNRVGRSNFFLV